MNTPQPSTPEIIAAIIQKFADLPNRLGAKKGDGDGAWTRQIKEDIGSLGVAHGWTVCSSGFERRFEPEWLYDLIWYRNDGQKHLEDVYLVLESEWREDKDHYAVRYDFEKLLIAKATLKVMVFQAWDVDIAELFEFLERGIRAFKKGSADETYLLVGFNNNRDAFDVRQIRGA